MTSLENKLDGIIELDENGYLPYIPPWERKGLPPELEEDLVEGCTNDCTDNSDQNLVEGCTNDCTDNSDQNLVEDYADHNAILASDSPCWIGKSPVETFGGARHRAPKVRYRGDVKEKDSLCSIGVMKISIAKAFGIVFGVCTAFHLGYFIWSFFYDPTTVFQLIGRGSLVMVFAYITYAIHSDIRSRVRYERDQPLYEAVAASMRHAHRGN